MANQKITFEILQATALPCIGDPKVTPPGMVTLILPQDGSMVMSTHSTLGEAAKIAVHAPYSAAIIKNLQMSRTVVVLQIGETTKRLELQGGQLSPEVSAFGNTLADSYERSQA